MFSSQLVRRAASAAIVLASCVAGSAHAGPVSGQGTWESTLQARYFTSDQSKGPDAYYDTALNITWLADANYANTVGYKGYGSYEVGGIQRQELAVVWANNLVIDGVWGWRLPLANPVNGSSYQYDSSVTGSADYGFNITSPNNELSHLYYVTLGNTARYIGRTEGGLTNTGPFENVQTSYWTGSNFPPGGMYWVWTYDFKDGSQSWDNVGRPVYYTWLVHPGDVGMPAVPEPETYALMLAGFGALALVARHRRAA